MRVEQDGDRYTGKLVDTTRVCSFAKGSDVLRGRIVDGLFTGELRICRPARCGAPDEWVLAVAAPFAVGEKLAGAIGAPDEACADLVFKNRPFVFARQNLAQLAAQLAPAEAPRQRRMKPEAQRLFREGMELSSAGRYDAARAKFESAGRLDPRNPDILNQIGITHYARGNFPEAEKHYRRALAADSDYTLAHYNLACVLAKQDRSKEALRALRRAVETGFASTSTMEADHDLDPLRDDPSFEEIRALAERNAARAGR